MSEVGIGIIGGGLMGREIASAFARWCAFDEPDLPTPVLRGAADLNPDALKWFERIPSVTTAVADYRKLLEAADIDVIYAAVPHHLHREIYLDVLSAGKDLLAEKPFGIDLAAARAVAEAAESSERFVRCSSEFPFFPAAQRIVEFAKSGRAGRLLEAVSGFHHSSDLDPDKAANWKRRSETCGEIGVMGDLGMHVLHVPLRLGFDPRSVFAQLQKGYPDRPDGMGGRAPCDTWDNAVVHTWIDAGANPAPMRLEMKRLAPGATNTWFLEVVGTDAGMRFSTADPKALHVFERAGKDQGWTRIELGFGTPFKTITGGIFEVGFPDLIQQMWAAFLLERAGALGGRFGCVTPAEAVRAHEIFAAALASQGDGRVVSLADS